MISPFKPYISMYEVQCPYIISIVCWSASADPFLWRPLLRLLYPSSPGSSFHRTRVAFIQCNLAIYSSACCLDIHLINLHREREVSRARASS